MSISTVKIFDIFYEETGNMANIHQYFFTFLARKYCNLKVPQIFKNWEGIDSTACYLVILESESKVYEIPKGFTKEEITRIYSRIKEEFKKCCAMHNFPRDLSLLGKKLRIEEIKKSLV